MKKKYNARFMDAMKSALAFSGYIADRLTYLEFQVQWWQATINPIAN